MLVESLWREYLLNRRAPKNSCGLVGNQKTGLKFPIQTIKHQTQIPCAD